jgi:hypothetical protein
MSFWTLHLMVEADTLPNEVLLQLWTTVQHHVGASLGF